MLNLVAKKMGMSHSYSENGSSTALTIIKLYDNVVLDLQVNEDKEFDNVLVAFEKAENGKNIKKPISGIFTKKSLPLHKKILGSQIKKNSGYKQGDIINVEDIVKKGDKIAVSGVSIGKGFAGVMKRHNFAGLEATHGVSVSHRSHGSTGQNQDPGKVFKGKKMAGHMGNKRVSVKNLQVLDIDLEKKLLFVKGAVPGSRGGYVVLKIDN